MDQKLLKSRNDLVVSGMGVIIFGIWSVIKTIMYAILQMRPAWDSIESELRLPVVIIAILFVVIICSVSLLIRITIGRSAIREGKGGKSGKLYIALAWVVLTFDVIGALLDLLSFGRSGILDSLAVLAVDVTMIATLVNLLVSAGRSRKLTRSLKAGDASCR